MQGDGRSRGTRVARTAASVTRAEQQTDIKRRSGLVAEFWKLESQAWSSGLERVRGKVRPSAKAGPRLSL